jgi:hypothetical protein
MNSVKALLCRHCVEAVKELAGLDVQATRDVRSVEIGLGNVQLVGIRS